MQIGFNKLSDFLFTISDQKNVKHEMPTASKVVTIAIAIIAAIPTYGIGAIAVLALSKYFFKLTTNEGIKEAAAKALNTPPLPTQNRHQFPTGAELNLNIPGMEDYSGSYNYAAQIAKIKQAEADGKNVRFIIGRGNVEQANYPLISSQNTEWVYFSYFSHGLSSRDNKPHIWGDLNDENLLQRLSTDLAGVFEEICLDVGTWNWIKNREKVLECFYQLLKKDGVLRFQDLVRAVQDDPALFPDVKNGKIPSVIHRLTQVEIDQELAAVKKRTLEFLTDLFGFAEYHSASDYPTLEGADDISFYEAHKIKIESAV